MFLTAALTVGGSILLGLAARRDEKNPFLVLGGLVGISLAGLLHLTGPEPLIQSLGFAAAELGTGFLVIAGMVAGNRDQARPFFLLGAGTITLGLAIILARSFFGPTVTILVELGPDDTYSEIAAVVEAHGGIAEKAFPMVDLSADEDLAQVYLIRVPQKYLDKLRELLGLDTENVDHIELNTVFELNLPTTGAGSFQASQSVLENDPLVSSQWGLDAIRGHEAHKMLKDLKPVRKAILAIVDTGVDAAHEDMNGIFEASPGSKDLHGHGTHCAGIAAAATNNALGIASLNWEGRFVSVISYSALDANGSGTLESTAQALIEAAQAGADVISMSLGSPSLITPKTIVDAVAFARKRGAVVVVAAGNSNLDARGSVPASVAGVIAVGAVNEKLQKAPFSNTTNRLSMPISAPGVDILSLKPKGGYVKLSGTSMATPMVAGLIGVMRSLNPDLSDTRIYEILRDTGRTTGASKTLGQMIDAEGAIAAALDG
ncbi:MAG: thermitase [Rhodothermales bacterium]|jgi:thermitase